MSFNKAMGILHDLSLLFQSIQRIFFDANNQHLPVIRCPK